MFGEFPEWDKVEIGDYIQIWNVPIREKVEFTKEREKIYTGKPEIGWFSNSKMEKEHR